MNHLSTSFTSPDGRVYKCHSWELREGGYRRIALALGGGLRPFSEESRLLGFLIERGFRVLGIDMAFGAPAAPRVALRAYREALSAFARAKAEPGLPLYLIATSFSAGAALPAAISMPALAAVALLSPVVEFPPPGLKKSLFFIPSAELAVRPEDLCGEPELAAAAREAPVSIRFRKRDLKTAAGDLISTLGEGLSVPVGAFLGDDDPFITQEGRRALSASGVKLYGYPRVKHEPGRDRYSDNYFADLGSFLDEAESKGKRKAT
jgi:hypothetical protein